MASPLRHWAVVSSLAVTVALATPALASASAAKHGGADNRAGAVGAHPAAQVAAKATAGVHPLGTYAFPSSSSTVVASVGFIDDTQVGYFWSASRGDSVEQTFSGPAKVKKAILKLDVTDNVLAPGAEVDWSLSVNGKDVGSFVITSGQTGPVTEKYSFRRITGGTYDVKIYVTNEVASGDGSIALRYAGTGPHSITLKRR